MKKVGILLAIAVLVVSMMPGVAAATTYNNDTPSGVTLLGWSSTPNDGGKNTVINFLYTGGFRSSMGIDAPFNSSWHALDDVRPVLLAEQERYGNYLGGPNGSFGSNVKFSANVLAAMKIQDFNPVQVGGANIPPSSTTLTSAEIAWLKKDGYSVQSVSQPKSTSTSKPVRSSTSPQSQVQSQPKPAAQQAPSTQSHTTAVTPAQSTSSTKTSSITSDPQVGKTAKSPTGSATPQTIAEAKQFAADHPPSLNPKNIPIKIPASPKKKTNLLTSLLKNMWVWVGTGVLLLALVAIAGRIIYLKRTA